MDLQSQIESLKEELGFLSRSYEEVGRAGVMGLQDQRLSPVWPSSAASVMAAHLDLSRSFVPGSREMPVKNLQILIMGQATPRVSHSDGFGATLVPPGGQWVWGVAGPVLNCRRPPLPETHYFRSFIPHCIGQTK